MAALIFSFATMQISLVLHNETLREAFQAHWQFVRRRSFRFGWFLLLCSLHYWFLALADAIIRAAATDRPLALIVWKLFYVLVRAIVSGWLLASWVCLFRQCEIGRVNRESWIRY
jgi:membrane-anchored glycerophosphoryl diester phosphodiesterase (GDPDase)